MPKQAHAKERHAERNFANLQGKAFFETHGEAFRNDSNRIGLRHEVRNRKEMRRSALKAAAESVASQNVVNKTAAARASDVCDVFCGGELTKRERPLQKRVTASPNHDVVLVEKIEGLRAGGKLGGFRKKADSGIECALVKGVFRWKKNALGAMHKNLLVGSGRLEQEKEWAEDAHFGVVCHGNSKGSCGSARVEGLRGIEGRANMRQSGVDGLGKRECPGSWPHAARGTNEKFIAKEGAKTSEGIAHGGLGEPDASCGGAHISLFQKSLEGKKQVQIDRSNIHVTYSSLFQLSIT